MLNNDIFLQSPDDIVNNFAAHFKLVLKNYSNDIFKHSDIGTFIPHININYIFKWNYYCNEEIKKSIDL